MSDVIYSADNRFHSPTKAALASQHRERRERNCVPPGRVLTPVIDRGIDLLSGRAKGIKGWAAVAERRAAAIVRAEIKAVQKTVVEKPVTKLTFDEAGAVIRDWLDVTPAHRTSEIVQEVALQFGVSVAEINSARRTTNLIAPRHIAMTLCKYLTDRSLPEIGRRIGMRDHTTVLHACRKYQPLLDAVSVGLSKEAPIGVWVAAFKQQAETTQPLKWQSTGQAIERA